MCFASLFRIQLYLPEKFLVLFPNQNNDSQALTGSGTVVYFPLKIYSVLLENNLQECSSVDSCHTFSSEVAARGRSGSSPEATAQQETEVTLAAHLHQPPPQRTPSHTFWSERSLFPSAVISVGAGCFCQYAHTFAEHRYERRTLVMVTGAKETPTLTLSSDRYGMKRSLKSIPKSQRTWGCAST